MDQLKAETFFLALYDQFADAIFRYCYFRVSSRELAEDLMQESFMKAWKYLCDGHEIDNPKAFLYKTAGNLVIDHYRRKKESSLEALAEKGFDPQGDTASTITNYAAGREALLKLAELAPDHRDILILRYVDGLSIKEIAAAYGLSENAISVRVYRAIHKLKKLLSV